MKQSSYSHDSKTESLQDKFNVEEYLSYWRWFILSIIGFVLLGLLYLRYATVIYESTAKIKVIEDTKELDIAIDPLASLAGNSSVNLSNEMEILRSFRLLSQVVETLDLDIRYFKGGKFSAKEIYAAPFKINKLFPEDSLNNTTQYYISFETTPATIKDEFGYSRILDSPVTVFKEARFPISVVVKDSFLFSKAGGENYKVEVSNRKKEGLKLTKDLVINLTNKDSEILALSLRRENAVLSETILNTVIQKFNEDGINDRQQVSKRTLAFIDERFEYLTQELDSIEGGKQDFKIENNLSYIETDAESSLLRKAATEDEVAELGTQISLASVLGDTVQKQSNYELLPANIGLESGDLNTLVSEYNKMALERNRMMVNVNANHPRLIEISGQLDRAKSNILKTVNVYQSQLRTSLYRLNEQKNQARSAFSSLPEKEKMLRSIERQQSIKENLFLLLLQKREEAAISLAVTAPSVKVVDYALTESRPVTPNKAIVIFSSMLLGFLTPFSILFFRSLLNTKIHGKEDLETLGNEIPYLGEIPGLAEPNRIINYNERSVDSEAFRILSTSTSHLLNKKNGERGKVILVTSSVKGEGKTQISKNLSVAYAGFGKKVLLIGADFRNPQLGGLTKFNSATSGLSSYMAGITDDWEECIQEGYHNNRYHKICYSGVIPENEPQLLSNERFSKFINAVKPHFDYIVVDSAPTMLVSDTLIIASQADLTVYVVRANYTEKRFLEFSEDLFIEEKLPNMAYVLNDVDSKMNKLYNYGYSYTNDETKTERTLIGKLGQLFKN